MNLLEFFLGNGWLIPWYILFTIVGMIPSVLFLGFVRRVPKVGMSEGLYVSYSIGTALLTVFSVINTLLLGAALPIDSLLKYPILLIGLILVLSVYQLYTTRCLRRDLLEHKKNIIIVHILVTILYLMNLLALWIFQNRSIFQ